MSHSAGLEWRREAPPPLRPLLSPLGPPRGFLLSRCCAAITESPSPIWLSKGPQEGAAWSPVCEQNVLGCPELDRLQPGWRSPACGVRRLVRSQEPGQLSGVGRRGGGGEGGLRSLAGVAGRGARGGPSPGISGDRVTAPAEREPSGTPGPAADGPSPPPPAARARQRLSCLH